MTGGAEARAGVGAARVGAKVGLVAVVAKAMGVRQLAVPLTQVLCRVALCNWDTGSSCECEVLHSACHSP